MKTTGKLITFIFTFLALAASAYAADDSPLFEAIKKGDKAAVEALLAKGAGVNAKDEYGWTPLYSAACEGKKDIAELLLAKGADVNAKDNNGKTPLHEAARCGRKDVIELLLAKGADINAKDKYGDTPLNTATKEMARLVAAQQVYKNDAFMYAMHEPAIRSQKDTAELLENHILKQANPRMVFAQLTEQLKSKLLKSKLDDISIRRLIIKLASEMKPAPPIPEEARKHFVEGTAIVKAAKNPAQQALAAQSFTEALKVAPWWGDAYYNLGVAQELAEKYDEAEQAFNFYLLSNPKATEKREVQDRIYALSAKRKLLGAK